MTIPAVVVGMELGGLGVVRSLGCKGVPTIALDSFSRSAEMKTRFATKSIFFDVTSPALIDRLLQISEGIDGKAVLISTRRIPTVLISEHRDLLAERFLFRLPEHQQLSKLENKNALASIAEETGIRFPRTILLTDENKLSEAKQLTYPCILKPSDNNPVYMSRFKKAYKVESHSDTERLFAEIHPYYQLLTIQEWVPGPDTELFFCLQYRNAQAKPLASFVGRKILSWPPGTGATASCVAAVEHGDRVEDITNKFFDTLGLVGFASTEFKRHPDTGEFFLIEPTAGRTDQQEEVATLNGVNIPYCGYLDLIGADAYEPDPDTRIHGWRNTRVAKWAAESVTDKSFAELAKNAVWHDARWRVNDPVPGLWDLMRQIRVRVFR